MKIRQTNFVIFVLCNIVATHTHPGFTGFVYVYNIYTNIYDIYKLDYYLIIMTSRNSLPNCEHVQINVKNKHVNNKEARTI